MLEGPPFPRLRRSTTYTHGATTDREGRGHGGPSRRDKAKATCDRSSPRRRLLLRPATIPADAAQQSWHLAQVPSLPCLLLIPQPVQASSSLPSSSSPHPTPWHAITKTSKAPKTGLPHPINKPTRNLQTNRKQNNNSICDINAEAQSGPGILK